MLQLQGRPRNESTTYPPWTSHRCHTALTPLEAHATAAVGNDVRLAQCESIAELRVAVRGRLDILRPRNGESVTLWVAKHVRGQGRGESTDFPKRR